MQPGKLWGMRRLADASGLFRMLAVDQRPPIKRLIAERRNQDSAPYGDVCNVKALLVDELSKYASAALLDPHYAYPASIGLLSPAKGLLLTLEDSVFEETPGGRLSSEIDQWSVEKIKRLGGDAVKVLAWYRPDAQPAVLAHQQGFVRRIGEACRRFDIPYVLELLVYPLPGEAELMADYVEDPDKRVEHVIESVETFAAAEFGVDLFKLECPFPASTVPKRSNDNGSFQAGFDHLSRAANRPWVMLSAGATPDAFRRVLEYAYVAGASGYLAGRAIWWDAFQAFPDLDDMRHRLATESAPYMQELNRLTEVMATPWTGSSGMLGRTDLDVDGAEFRAAYPGMEAEWDTLQ
ncbi:MAG: tagatose 1,6-diphosphate aldolase [Acidimicrobiia bacterium]|nr:tagatose 1,6-diphosphate aldolase [Acidimicrobiia bacterium]NNL26868.1 tagatose 1,6-diphosphate aldolase [Acidimicrobiia bacterium]